MEARHLRIIGNVQGVGFRYHTVAAAKRLGIKGWVRNCRDGSVEAAIAGDAEVIAAMIDWARRGPPAATVLQVIVEQLDGLPDADDFVQLPTA